MGSANVLTPEQRSKGGKLGQKTLAVARAVERQVDKLAQVADTASTYVRSYLEQPDPKKSNKSRLLVMTESIYHRACAGDVRAYQALLDRAYSKPAMAAADREAGRPILQMTNNQINVPSPTSDPSSLPSLPTSSARTIDLSSLASNATSNATSAPSDSTNDPSQAL